MGYSLQIDAETVVPLASNGGWSAVCDWVKGLPESAALKHLCHYGWEDDLTGLEAQLKTALHTHAPKNHELHETTRNLLAILMEHSGAKVVSVTDGLGA